jgi:hypothetical protein
MKTTILLSALFLATGPLLAAPREDVTAAATALGNAANYTWQTTQDYGANWANSQYKPGPIDGKTEKDGYTMVSLNTVSNVSGMVRKGTKAALHTTDKGWQTMTVNGASQVYNERSPERSISIGITLELPAVEATNLIAWASDWKVEGDKIIGTFTEDGAARVLGVFNSRYGRPSIPPGVGGSILIASSSNAKGTVTFWIKDGKLTKYQTHITASVDTTGSPRPMDEDRTKTVTIKDIGTTKVVVPDEAKEKLQ